VYGEDLRPGQWSQCNTNLQAQDLWQR